VAYSPLKRTCRVLWAAVYLRHRRDVACQWPQCPHTSVIHTGVCLSPLQEEVEWGDLEVRTQGLSFFCRLPLTCPGPVTDVRPGSSGGTASRLTSDHVSPASGASEGTTAQQGASTPGTPHCPSTLSGDGVTTNSTWLQGASLQAGCTRPVFLLSPFYYRPASEAITLLLHHMAWHSRLGFCSYLWWVGGWLGLSWVGLGVMTSVAMHLCGPCACWCWRALMDQQMCADVCTCFGLVPTTLSIMMRESYGFT
jgi:hypothetical protein